jgi:pimeloyl-ACP methyl ester carboxylesterase
MSTLNVAKDLDLLRQAVGDSKLTYAGYSYGTLIGATYANLFPGRVRALLLDGMVDPAERTQRSLLNELNRAGGFETALRGFLELCAASGPGCAFSSGDPKAKFVALRERLRRGPLTLSDGSTVNISQLTDYVAGNLYDPGAFPEMAETLQALYAEAFPASTAASGATTAARRSASAALARSGSFRPLGEAYSFNGTDTLFAVNCLDKKLPRGQALWPAIAVGFEAVHRTFGRTQAYTAAVCATWPVVTTERYAGPWDRRTSNTVLIVGTAYDPATPYLFAQRATQQLGRARLLTLDGYGHTSILSSTCIDEKTNNYILTGAVPPAGTVCEPDALPFDTAAAATTAAEKAVLEAVGRG